MKSSSITLHFFLAVALVSASPPSFAEEKPYPGKFGKVSELIASGNLEAAWEETGKLRAESGPAEESSIDYLAGYVLLSLDRPEEAESYLEKISSSPLMGDYVLSHLAELSEKKGDFKKVVRLAEALDNSYPYSPLREAIQLMKIRALGNLGEYEKSISLAKSAISQNTQEPYLFLRELAAMLEKAGRADEAYKVYQDIFYTYPYNHLSEAARLETVRMQKAYKNRFPLASAERKLERVRILVEKHRYHEAESYADTISPDDLPRQERTELLMLRAKSLDRTRKDREALAIFRKIINERPKTGFRPYAIYRSARIYWNFGNYPMALRMLHELLEEYPQHGEAPTAYYIIARINEAQNKYEDAIKNMEACASLYPKSSVAETCMWHIGWWNYLQRNHDRAETAFADFASKYPYSEYLPQVAYWRAKNLEAMGKSEAAAGILQGLQEKTDFSFYAVSAKQNILSPLPGTLAGNGNEKLGENTARKIEDVVRKNYPLPKLEGKPKWLFDASENWISLGFGKRAKPLIDSLSKELSNTVENLIWISYLYHQAGYYDRVLSQSWKFPSDSLKNEALREHLTWMIFPLAYWNTVQSEASKYGIDPLLVLAIIRQESAFDPWTVSVADARGLMQIIPSTGVKISRALAMEDFSVEKLHDPEINIKMGTFYMSYLLKNASGELVPAIASYNAGASVVKKWVERYPYENIEEFIERIPYPETRGYVKKVLRNYGIYQQIYSGSTESRVISKR